MKFTIITLFPEVIEPYLGASMMWKAKEKGIVEYEVINLRDFGLGFHKKVDDAPYGGGDGMLLRVEPIFAAIEYAKKTNPGAKVLLPTPRGQTWSQPLVRDFAAKDENYIIICPHYEGYDERILTLVDAEISLGKYILTGGELPALIIIDSIVRLLPGVLGGETSAEIESFSDGDNLEYPQYTRPETFQDLKVPEILLSGNHAEIAKWRAENSKTAK
jgi:tRNA (guanine37-N1)-methyltransferase